MQLGSYIIDVKYNAMQWHLIIGFISIALFFPTPALAQEEAAAAAVEEAPAEEAPAEEEAPDEDPEAEEKEDGDSGA